jgi:hypothetical protein
MIDKESQNQGGYPGSACARGSDAYIPHHPLSPITKRSPVIPGVHVLPDVPGGIILTGINIMCHITPVEV